MASSTHVLTVPARPNLLQALGRLAIAHTHLELMLRYCVKTIARLTTEEALDATAGDRLSDLRSRIRNLFKERKPTALERNRLDALLEKAKRLSETRNAYLHRAWSETPEGLAVTKGDHYEWESAPSDSDIEAVTSEILGLVQTLNEDRLRGFIYHVLHRLPQIHP